MTTLHLTLKMTTAQVVETSVTNNSLSKDYPHPEDHTKQVTDTPGFKPFTKNNFSYLSISAFFVWFKIFQELFKDLLLCPFPIHILGVLSAIIDPASIGATFVTKFAIYIKCKFETNLIVSSEIILALYVFCNNGSRDIVTPKMMCNHNIISRNEKNRSKLVILIFLP